MRRPLKPILLVEDDPNDIFLLRRAFRQANVLHPISVVEDGVQATAYLAGEKKFADRLQHPLPSLMILDLKLPRKGGVEVLTWLRAQEAPLSRLPVIVLTSSRQLTDVNKAYDAGANSYLVKPGEFDRLLELVSDLDHYWFEFSQSPEL